MRKRFLMTPGPTPVPPEAAVEEAKPIIHHRTKEFRDIFSTVMEDIKIPFKTKNEVYIFASSGTGAMEGAVANTLSRGDKAICIMAGKFGERWGEICRAFGVEVVPIQLEWGETCEPDLLSDTLKKNPDVKAVFTTLCETSTGTLFKIKEFGEIVKEKEDTILVVDAISGLCADNIEVDAWHVDICVAASQKGIMLPPGLAFFSISEKAWRLVEKSDLPKYYFDFKAYKKAFEKQGDTPYTPAVSLIRALRKSLDIIKEEGIDNVLRRHALMAEATRRAIKALGFELLSKYPANTCTAIKYKDGMTDDFRKHLLNKYGVQVAGGQSHLKGKIFRIAHLGYMEKPDVIYTIAAIEMALHDLGMPVEFGKGVVEAEKILKDL